MCLGTRRYAAAWVMFPFLILRAPTYWYHAYTWAEQTGLYGALIAEPREPVRTATTRCCSAEHVELLLHESHRFQRRLRGDVRLRFIGTGTATYFDVRIPGLKLTVVSTDGQCVEPAAR